MFPGPTIIKYCANCAQPFAQETLLSGNTFGAKFWTDGKREAPMLPDQHALINCPHCQALLWIDEQQTLSEVDWGERDQFKNARAYLVPVFEDYLVALESDGLDLEKKQYLRRWAWWTGNNPRRKSVTPQPLSVPETENLLGLAELLNESNDDDRLMKAEILRELGRFTEARVLLNGPFDLDYAQPIAIIRDCIDRSDPFVQEMRFESSR